MTPFGELTEAQRAVRLTQALALSDQARKRLYGIGMQKERTVHSVLKFYLEPDGDQHEIPIGSFIADIYHHDPQEVWEIQTAGFGSLRKKLDFFLEQMPVTIIHPIPWHKWIYWSDPKTGEVSAGHKSPKTGQLHMILPELYRISAYLRHPNLSLLPILLDVQEYRILDGWSQDRKRGAHRIDRIPLCIGPSVMVRKPTDLVRLLPELPHPFTSKDFTRVTRFSPRASSYALSALKAAGCVVQCGRDGRNYLYQLITED